MLFWHLPASLRCELAAQRRAYSVTARLHEPLRILFCGSDEFSIASLRALDEERRRAPDLIHSIDVVHRPAKPSGRRLKTLREGMFYLHRLFSSWQGCHVRWRACNSLKLYISPV